MPAQSKNARRHRCLSGPIDIGGDVETAIRKDILSAGLLKEVDRSISRATDGQLVVTSRRKVVTKTYSGFEATIKITADNGKAVYVVATRSIVQNDRGMQISSISTSEATARANLNSYLARTTITRVSVRTDWPKNQGVPLQRNSPVLFSGKITSAIPSPRQRPWRSPFCRIFFP